MSGSSDSAILPISYLSSEPLLQFIDVSNDDLFLVGTSNVVYNVWTGGLLCFSDPDSAVGKTNCYARHNIDEGPAVCGTFIAGSNKVITGEDSGQLAFYEVYPLNENTIDFVPLRLAVAHDGAVRTLSTTSNMVSLVTGGDDLRINVVNIETSALDRTFSSAHCRQVTCVSTHPSDSSMFASTSLDGLALLWDVRLSAAASEILDDDSGLKSVCWKSQNELIIGTESGFIKLIDLRTLSLTKEQEISDQPIHKTVMNSNGLVAVCCDSNVIKVWHSDLYKIMYEDKRHGRFVRDILWHTNKLYSAGFDGQILCHNVL